MKHLILLISLLLVAYSSPEMQILTSSEGELDSIHDEADRYLTKLTELEEFNGAVLLKKEGEIVLKKAYNLSSDTSSTLYVTNLSQFDLRSVAKLFAKISLLDLSNENRLRLDDPVSKYLPDFPEGDRITLDMLMKHSSGLPRELSEGPMRPIEMKSEDVIRLASNEDLEFDPGSQNQYSNVGYQLLYYIIGQLHGSSFSAYLKDTYFSPLQMEHTGSNFNDPEDNKNEYAFGHYVQEGRGIQCECDFQEDEMQMGNLYSTVDDLDLFLSFLDNPRYDELLVDGSISHAGGTRGKRAYVERNLTDNYTIVFLTNYDKIPFEKLVRDLQNLLMGQKVILPKRVYRTATHVAPGILKKYTGTYDIADAGHLTLSIKFENDSLYLYQKGTKNGVLYPETDSVFFGDPSSEESIEFVKDSLGDYYMLLDFQGVRWKGMKISE